MHAQGLHQVLEEDPEEAQLRACCPHRRYGGLEQHLLPR